MDEKEKQKVKKTIGEANKIRDKDSFYKGTETRFPFELLVQVYNQRIKILHFAMIVTLAIIAAFYSTFFDSFRGDRGVVPIGVILVGLILTGVLHCLEARNMEIKKHLEKTAEYLFPLDYFIFHSKPSGRKLKYSLLITLIFFILYIIHSVLLGIAIYIKFNFLLEEGFGLCGIISDLWKIAFPIILLILLVFFREKLCTTCCIILIILLSIILGIILSHTLDIKQDKECVWNVEKI